MPSSGLLRPRRPKSYLASYAVSASRSISTEKVDVVSGGSTTGLGIYSGSFYGTASHAVTASFAINGGGGSGVVGPGTVNSIALFSASSGISSSIIFQSTNNIGIGISTPTNTLQVQGTVSASSYTSSLTNTVGFVGTSSWAQSSSIAITASGLLGGAVNYIPLWTSTTVQSSSALYQNSGNVGIGTTSLTYKLEVNGSARAADFILSSDRRLKTELEPIKDALAAVTKLTGYTFTMTKDNTRKAGLIAQDVQEILPEAVYTDNDGYLSLSYEQIIPMLVEAIKQLNEKIEKLK